MGYLIAMIVPKVPTQTVNRDEQFEGTYLNLLCKTYEPSKTIEVKFKRYDLAFKTDELGRPVVLFYGVKD